MSSKHELKLGCTLWNRIGPNNRQVTDMTAGSGVWNMNGMDVKWLAQGKKVFQICTNTIHTYTGVNLTHGPVSEIVSEFISV